MTRWQQVTVGLAAYAVWLIVMAPATLVDSGLQGLTQSRMKLVETRGTVWAGSGRVDMLDSAGRAVVTRSASWRLLPESLLRGELTGEIQLEPAARPFPVTFAVGHVNMANVDLDLPAGVVGLGVPKLAPLGLTGNLQIHVGRLSISRSTVQGDVSVNWRSAGSSLSPVNPLGDYELKLAFDSAMVVALLQTIRGPLQLDGHGSWPLGKAPDFLVKAKVPPEHLSQLGPLFRMMSIDRGSGTFEMTLR